MFLEQIKQFIICACLEIQIQKRLFQQATLSQGKQKNGQTWAGQSPQRLSWNDKWSPHISHLDYLENKITCWHCFFFSPAVHKTQKAVQVPQNSWHALCRDLLAPQSHCELFQRLPWTGPEAKLRCKPWEGPRHKAAIPALPSTIQLQWQWFILPCCHSYQLKCHSLARL